LLDLGLQAQRFFRCAKQALQPAIEHAKYVAGQYFDYILRDVADLSRQYADPENPMDLEGDRADIYIAKPSANCTENIKLR